MIEYRRIVKENLGKLPDGKRLGWVMGTGRCGSASFWNILNKQVGVACEAEFKRCPWKVQVNGLIHNLVRMYGVAMFYKDVYLSIASAMWFLPYTDIIMDAIPDSKIVCLKRDKRGTVNSWIKKSVTPSGDFRNWFTAADSKYRGGRESKHTYYQYYRCFPHFDLPFEEAVEAYYDEYYRMSGEMEEKYPRNFKVYESPMVLNNHDYQVEALSWLGVEDPVFHKIKRNESWQDMEEEKR